MTKEEAIDDIGEQADRLGNLLAATLLPMPAAFHMEQLKSSIEDIRGRLRLAYGALSGEYPWHQRRPAVSDEPAESWCASCGHDETDHQGHGHCGACVEGDDGNSVCCDCQRFRATPPHDGTKPVV